MKPKQIKNPSHQQPKNPTQNTITCSQLSWLGTFTCPSSCDKWPWHTSRVTAVLNHKGWSRVKYFYSFLLEMSSRVGWVPKERNYLSTSPACWKWIALFHPSSFPTFVSLQRQSWNLPFCSPEPPDCRTAVFIDGCLEGTWASDVHKSPETSSPLVS